MKKLFLTCLSLIAACSLAWAQFTPGISSNSTSSALEIGQAELFKRKENQRLRERIDLLERQNRQLEQRIVDLQYRLDQCGDRSRYSRQYRRNDAYYLNSDLLGTNRRLEREYESLKEENEFLRGQYDWLMERVQACEGHYRDEYRDRGRRGNNCGCQPKHKSKRKKKEGCEDDD